MKFYIHRTSTYYEEELPCKGAVLLNPVRDTWEEPLYGIEINNLEELIELHNNVDSHIILENTYNDTEYSQYEIEIYDSYRE